LGQTGILGALSQWLQTATEESLPATALGAGTIVAVASNLMNNLPVGLIAGCAATAANLPHQVTGALLIGVDLGPNLSVTARSPRFFGSWRFVAKATRSVPGSSFRWVWS